MKGTVLAETCVESYTLAEEIDEYNPELLNCMQEELAGLPCEKMPHTELKQRSAGIRFAIRTGEFAVSLF